ncbi:hypothetical protein [Erythrobacter sp. CCH5-A1]|jgi:hypothetical protein|uniref:hypothetical protein n=1 Tax=Erythrobacter sp. CCH5-A1 TaxID=1768792 RepID=UPI0008335BF4|nr:hypothetical protein [Erythrobacter sp. CCH5-A1]
MALVRQYFDDPRLAGLDISDSWLMGFVFEQGHAIRLFCDFHLTREHPEWRPFKRGDVWACYRTGSIVFRNCVDVFLNAGAGIRKHDSRGSIGKWGGFPRSTDGYDCGTMDTFEIHDLIVKVETGALEFEIHTTDFAVELDRVES